MNDSTRKQRSPRPVAFAPSSFLRPVFKTKETALSLVTWSHGCLVGTLPVCTGRGWQGCHCRYAKCAVPCSPASLPSPSFLSFPLAVCLPITQKAFVDSPSPPFPCWLSSHVCCAILPPGLRSSSSLPVENPFISYPPAETHPLTH